jgi:hypothetical protein
VDEKESKERSAVNDLYVGHLTECHTLLIRQNRFA